MDELTIHDDGSGTLKYAINLSSSRVKVNSILALEFLNLHYIMVYYFFFELNYNNLFLQLIKLNRYINILLLFIKTFYGLNNRVE